MLTESQKRALRAKTLLDSGKDAKEVARQLGYKSVTGMLGAISLSEAKIQRNEAVFEGSLRSPDPSPSVEAKIYPMENGMLLIRKKDITISYRRDSKVGPTVHLSNDNCKRVNKKPAWVALVSRDLGGKPALAHTLRQIAEAASECADLIEDEIKGGK